MQKLFVVAMTTFFITGCVNTTVRSDRLASLEGVEYETDKYGQQLIKSFAATIPDAGKEELGVCVAKNVDNKSIALSDGSKSFTGPVTGNYYAVQSVRQVGGGQNILFVSEDRNTFVAQGVSEYSRGLISRSVRFTLTAKRNDKVVNLVFEPIEQAQLNTGAIANTGYNKVGAWDAAGPYEAIESLNNVVKALENCLQ
jgi:hypothetical protein